MYFISHVVVTKYLSRINLREVEFLSIERAKGSIHPGGEDMGAG